MLSVEMLNVVAPFWNSLAYYNTELITAVKGFIVLAQLFKKIPDL